VSEIKMVCKHCGGDSFSTAPLTDDDLAHLVAVDEWLAALTKGAQDA